MPTLSHLSAVLFGGEFMSSEGVPSELQIENDRRLNYVAVMEGLAYEALELDTSIAGRTQYVAGVERTALGLSTVQNESRGNVDGHSYCANVNHSVPTARDRSIEGCRESACEYRSTVAKCAPVFEAISEYEGNWGPAVVTDGGTTIERSETCERRADRRPADCDCLPTFDDLPCWPCYREGFWVPNPAAKSDHQR